MSRGLPFRPKDPARIIERYLAGESPLEVGSDFGYTQAAPILKLLKNAGIKMRTPRESYLLGKERRKNHV